MVQYILVTYDERDLARTVDRKFPQTLMIEVISDDKVPTRLDKDKRDV